MDVTRRRFFITASVTTLSMVMMSACAQRGASASPDTQFAVTHSDAEWRKLLTAAQYNVLRNAGTEAPYSSPLNDEHRRGVFSLLVVDGDRVAQPVECDVCGEFSEFSIPHERELPSIGMEPCDADGVRERARLILSHGTGAAPAFSDITPGRLQR